MYNNNSEKKNHFQGLIYIALEKTGLHEGFHIGELMQSGLW